MTPKPALYLGCLFLLCLGCKTEDPDFPKELTGQWEINSFTVSVTTFGNQDSSFTLEIDPGQWPEKMSLQPERILFLMNHRFSSEAYNLDDELVYRRRGMWDLRGDTLLRLIEPKGIDDYRLRWLDADQVFIRGRLDWDRDGEIDDVYGAKLQRLRPETSTAAE